MRAFWGDAESAKSGDEDRLLPSPARSMADRTISSKYRFQQVLSRHPKALDFAPTCSLAYPPPQGRALLGGIAAGN